MPVPTNDQLCEVKEIKPFSRFDAERIVIFNKKHPNPVATLAVEFARHFSQVAGIPDGEDSAGRQQLRLATPQECAKRSCDLAEQMWEQFQSRGWVMDLPVPGIEGEDRPSE